MTGVQDILKVCIDRSQLCDNVYCCISSGVYRYNVATQVSCGEFGCVASAGDDFSGDLVLLLR